VKTMTDAFNNWTLPLVLKDPLLLNATMCMASAEMEIRHGTRPYRRSSSRTATDLANKNIVVSDYTYFKVQTIKNLNRTLCNPQAGKLSAANICAIMFLLWAEVGSTYSGSLVLRYKMDTDSYLANSGTAGTTKTFVHIYQAYSRL
jgi:hypothetical protein